MLSFFSSREEKKGGLQRENEYSESGVMYPRRELSCGGGRTVTFASFAATVDFAWEREVGSSSVAVTETP